MTNRGSNSSAPGPASYGQLSVFPADGPLASPCLMGLLMAVTFGLFGQALIPPTKGFGVKKKIRGSRFGDVHISIQIRFLKTPQTRV